VTPYGRTSESNRGPLDRPRNCYGAVEPTGNWCELSDISSGLVAFCLRRAGIEAESQRYAGGPEKEPHQRAKCQDNELGHVRAMSSSSYLAGYGSKIPATDGARAYASLEAPGSVVSAYPALMRPKNAGKLNTPRDEHADIAPRIVEQAERPTSKPNPASYTLYYVNPRPNPTDPRFYTGCTRPPGRAGSARVERLSSAPVARGGRD
jgi:hypothetical protein